MICVFFDDYRDLKVGAFPQDYSALGEYHFQLIEGHTGNWTTSTVHHSWRGNPSWIVTTENGERVLEIASIRQRAVPMVITGKMWKDITIKTAFRPLSTAGQFGIVFRYVSSRQYYALWYHGDMLQLILRADDHIQVLAKTAARLNCDQYYAVEIIVKGAEITAVVDNHQLKAVNSHYSKGKVGFAGTHPVRFQAIKVFMTQLDYTAHKEEDKIIRQRLPKKRQLYPQPKLWKKIYTPEFGAGKSIRFGDLNNDGKKEILIAQNIRRMRGDNFCELSCLTAIDLDGTILWQIGEANPENALVSNDLPMQIHDIDGDGSLEVIFCKDFKINVVDGKTGKLKYQAFTPYAPPHKGNKMPEDQYNRITGDSLYFSDLSKQGVARDLLIKDRYNNIWAYTWDLKLLWHYQGNCGHYPMACDIDNDGRDEILIGYTLLDHDGKVLWSLDIADHADGVAIGKFGTNQEWQFIIAASDEGMYWVDIEGNITKHHRIGHCQTATIAPLIKDSERLQVATVTFWGNPGIIAFLM